MTHGWRGRAWRLALLVAVCLAPKMLTAQTAEAHIDSLYKALPTAQGYFSPRPIQDTTLLTRLAQAEGRRAEQVRQHIMAGSFGQGRATTLSDKLSLPLVTHYRSADKYVGYLPAFASMLDSKGFASLSPPSNRRLSLTETALMLEESVMQYLQGHRLDLFDVGGDALMAGRERLVQLGAQSSVADMVRRDLETERVKDLAEHLRLQEIEKRYWIPSFESSIQFSQNYVSDNWYKGGTSNLNLYMRTYLSLLYTKGAVRWNNEVEDKLSLYTADHGGKRYRIGEDLFRLRSNFGLKASKRWSYTIDAEARTQLFYTYNDARTVIRSAPWAPLTTNVGIGMQYTYSSRSSKVYGRKFAFSMNLAPLSHTWRVSSRSDIDLARHGLSPEQRSYHRIGSTMRMNLKWDVNMDVNWESRVYFNTSYSNVEAEWENTLTLRISRYFSTRINLHLRFDDAVVSKRESGWDKYIQLNEVLSFGFNFKV